MSPQGKPRHLLASDQQETTRPHGHLRSRKPSRVSLHPGLHEEERITLPSHPSIPAFPHLWSTLQQPCSCLSTYRYLQSQCRDHRPGWEPSITTLHSLITNGLLTQPEVNLIPRIILHLPLLLHSTHIIFKCHCCSKLRKEAAVYDLLSPV